MNVIDRILLTEGGYVNDPDDRGGETKFGVSKRHHPDIDIKNLTREKARDILVNEYIVAPGFDTLTPGVLRDQLIDYGYHSGPPQAIRSLQQILGVEVDGKLGPGTRAALLKGDALKLNTALVKKRVEFLSDIIIRRPANLKFLRGWMKRALSFLEA